jgi:hypothetical protein
LVAPAGLRIALVAPAGLRIALVAPAGLRIALVAPAGLRIALVAPAGLRRRIRLRCRLGLDQPALDQSLLIVDEASQAP